MVVATYDDVAVALGRSITTEAEQSQVDWWLSSAEMLIRMRLGDLTALDQDALFYVVVEAVAAKARRHGTLEESVTVSVDDGSVTRRYRDPMASEDITDAWWNLLNPVAASAEAFTVSPFTTRRNAPVLDCADLPWRRL